MAKLSDVSTLFRTVGPFAFAKRVYQQVNDDNLFAWAAALAYAWLFAIFPFMISLLSLLPLLPDRLKEDAKAEIWLFLQDSLSNDAFSTIWDNVELVLQQPRTGFLGLGLLFAIWAASGGMNMTITALDRCYEIHVGRPFYIQRPLAIAITIVVAALIILLMALLPLGTLVIHWLEAHGQYAFVRSPLAWSARILRYPFALLVMFLVLGIVYHFGPRIKQPLRLFTPGAVFCVCVWILLALFFRIYLDTFGKTSAYRRTYGTVGGAAILLFFFYIDALVLLIGAEINSEIDFEVLGIKRGSTDFRPVACATPAEPATASG
jgi:membrane protein